MVRTERKNIKNPNLCYKGYLITQINHELVDGKPCTVLFLENNICFNTIDHPIDSETEQKIQELLDAMKPCSVVHSVGNFQIYEFDEYFTTDYISHKIFDFMDQNKPIIFGKPYIRTINDKIMYGPDSEKVYCIEKIYKLDKDGFCFTKRTKTFWYGETVENITLFENGKFIIDQDLINAFNKSAKLCEEIKHYSTRSCSSAEN
jgi:hypothetical protein